MTSLLHHIHWRPGIHDPSLVGWIIFSGYLLSAAIAAWVGFKSSFDMPSETKKQLLWRIVGLVMILMAVNKQLDLQSLGIDIGRAVARSRGWYQSRRTFQKFFALAFGIIALGMFASALWYLRDILKDYYLLIIGFCFLGTFIVVRAAMFQHIHIDPPLTIPRIRIRWLFELAGSLLVSIAGIAEIAKKHPKSQKQS
ncbi:MAG: hypothetical protein GF401_20475 [Chitinivibrionales bacterium]|nr:hypothetical protein [Chitinivibrionales bacterium]